MVRIHGTRRNIWYSLCMDDTVEIERVAPGPMEPLLTVREAALTLRVSRQTVWRRVRAGELRAVRLGGPGSTVRIPARAVNELMRNYVGVA
jgi:excisionase family DNA binding protein